MANRSDRIRAAHGAGEGQQSVSVTTTSAATANAIGAQECVVYSTVECFAVANASPTATVAAGTPIPALALIRLDGLSPNDRIAFIAATGSGTVYVRPGA